MYIYLYIHTISVYDTTNISVYWLYSLNANITIRMYTPIDGSPNTFDMLSLSEHTECILKLAFAIYHVLCCWSYV